VDGEPNGGDRECFPPALRPPLEPLAADARPQEDSRDNARLKLLADMLGVSFDVLKRRDNQRRIRRLEVVMVIALALVAAFAGLAGYANQQRVKAVEARRQAESLLEFLLYDMREALGSVGRLDLMKQVQQRVDEYYRQLGVDPNDPGTQGNRLLATVRAGDAALIRGHTGSALVEYRAALEIAERLLQGEPDEAESQRNLALIHGRMGEALQAQGDLRGALAEYRADLAVAERLAAADPSNVSRLGDLWAVYWEVADVMERSADFSATAYWQRAFDTLSAIEQAGTPLSPLERESLEQLRQKLRH